MHLPKKLGSHQQDVWGEGEGGCGPAGVGVGGGAWAWRSSAGRGGRGALRLFCLRAGRAWGCSAGAKPRRQEEEEEEEMSGPMSPSGGGIGRALPSAASFLMAWKLGPSLSDMADTEVMRAGLCWTGTHVVKREVDVATRHQSDGAPSTLCFLHASRHVAVIVPPE